MNAIDRYLELYKKFPSSFLQNENLKLCLDRNILKQYAKKESAAIGVIYEDSYHIFAADLIENNGRYYPYTRFLTPNKTGGVVMIPFVLDKIVLLKQFRHGTRSFEYELPRGFSEPGLSPMENAEREITEELGASILSIEPEGSVVSDSSLSGGIVHIFSVTVDQVQITSGYEGIEEVLYVSLNEVKEMILNNTIRDGYTICAVSRYLLNHTLL